MRQDSTPFLIIYREKCYKFWHEKRSICSIVFFYCGFPPTDCLMWVSVLIKLFIIYNSQKELEDRRHLMFNLWSINTGKIMWHSTLKRIIMPFQESTYIIARPLMRFEFIPSLFHYVIQISYQVKILSHCTKVL